jgi:hypothetical protein
VSREQTFHHTFAPVSTRSNIQGWVQAPVQAPVELSPRCHLSYFESLKQREPIEPSCQFDLRPVNVELYLGLYVRQYA